MITAIPMNDQNVASHFSKALSFAFFNELGQEVSRASNPANDSSCGGKTKLLKLFQEQGVQRVLVRHIGEQMLSRLLSNSLHVFQCTSCRNSVDELAKAPKESLKKLTSPSQGTPSVNHEKKAQSGHSCCHKTEGPKSSEQSQCCDKGSNWHARSGHSASHHIRGHRSSRCCRS